MWLDFTLGIVQTSSGFLPKGFPDNLPLFGPLKCRLPGYLDGDAHSIHIKLIVVGFGIPHDDFVSARESALVVEAMTEMPNDPVA